MSQYRGIKDAPSAEVDVRLALYLIDLGKMVQTNKFTGYQRSIYKDVKKHEKKADYIVDSYKNSDIQVVFTVHE